MCPFQVCRFYTDAMRPSESRLSFVRRLGVVGLRPLPRNTHYHAFLDKTYRAPMALEQATAAIAELRTLLVRCSNVSSVTDRLPDLLHRARSMLDRAAVELRAHDSKGMTPLHRELQLLSERVGEIERSYRAADESNR